MFICTLRQLKIWIIYYDIIINTFYDTLFNILLCVLLLCSIELVNIFKSLEIRFTIVFIELNIQILCALGFLSLDKFLGIGLNDWGVKT